MSPFAVLLPQLKIPRQRRRRKFKKIISKLPHLRMNPNLILMKNVEKKSFFFRSFFKVELWKMPYVGPAYDSAISFATNQTSHREKFHERNLHIVQMERDRGGGK